LSGEIYRHAYIQGKTGIGSESTVMNRKKILFITLLSIFILAAAIAIYYYTHPEAAVSLIARTVTRYAGVSVRIKGLTYSLHPLRIAAEEIAVTPGSGSSGFSLKIPKLDARMALEGPFGNRHLVIDRLRITGFTFTYNQAEFHPIPKKAPSVPEAPSFLMRLAAFLLFKDIRFEDIVLTGGKGTAHLNGSTLALENIRARRSPEKRIEVAAGILLQWPTQETKIRIPDLRLSLNDALSLSTPILKGSVWARQIRLDRPGLTLADINLDLEGDIDVSTRRLNAPAVSLWLGENFHVTGALTAHDGSQPDAALSISEAAFVPEKLLPLLPDSVTNVLPPFTLSGRVTASGSINIIKKPSGWNWRVEADLGFSQNPFSYTAGKRRAQCRITGTLDVEADAANVNLTGDLKLNDAHLSDSSRSADISEARISITGAYPVFHIKSATARISRLNGIAAAQAVPLNDIRVTIDDGVVDLESAAYRFTGIQLESPLIRNLTATLTAGKKTVRMKLEGKKTGLVPAAPRITQLPAGWQVDADDAVSIDAVMTLPDTLSFETRMHLEKMRMQDPDTRLMAENVAMTVQVKGQMALSDASVSGTVAVHLTGGEILYDLYYVDLKATPFSLSGQSAYRPSDRMVTFKDLNLTLEHIVTMIIAGRMNLKKPRGVQLSLTVPPAPLGPLFKLFVVDPFQSNKPNLAAVTMGGRVGTDLAMENSNGPWSVKGRFQWQDGSLFIKDTPFSLDRIRLDVPVWYEAAPVLVDEAPLKGNIAIGQMILPPMPEQGISFPITATPNHLSIPQSTTLRIPGGSATLGPVSLREIFSTGISAKTVVTMNPTDTAPLLASVWPDMPESPLSGTLDPVIIRGDRIETVGTLTWKAFGGTVSLSRLGVDRFLSRGALVRVTARLSDLNLGQITAGTAFGRVDGLLNGSVKDLEIAYGQPQAFDLLLETEKKPGIPQKISIKAVDNIARIGGGQSPFMGLAGAFSSLFETLNYEKIGIRATLENDLFTINGTVRDQGREFLMKGSLIAGVNIINQNPDNRIRFKDMVKRIRRATSSGAKPVIR